MNLLRGRLLRYRNQRRLIIIGSGTVFASQPAFLAHVYDIVLR